MSNNLLLYPRSKVAFYINMLLFTWGMHTGDSDVQDDHRSLQVRIGGGRLAQTM